MAPKLDVIICSTRPGRVGKPVGDWFDGVARQHGGFEVELVDLAEVNLPIYDEPKHPRLQQYEHEHTRRWSAIVDAADAFVFVTPEYNFGPPPSLVNALNYVYLEWNYKPAGFVSYGGVSGGMRAVQTEKLTLTTLKMVPILETVLIPMVPQHIDKETGAFRPTDIHASSATAMLDELLRWTNALKPLRQKG
ncbi:NADPH-dependent FMN reductase [Enterovirga aerilata]|uniref:NAD(P)H-dependent oxidoreductase n=1 Tax=Enterovirga aerilata TaxID=2730920 RepID=A0A849I3M3_9HYPH|nr:NAD(P)H-dependent oxidoreductase [Enterovirga sp. DB1703]NNM70989.1 NAD(P)H-dependent oxidoreductase [Enterovirga sp. DB1703]